MNLALDQKAISDLQTLCGTVDAARALFDIFAQRQKDSRETSVERAAWLAGVDYGSMVQVFKRLGEIGVGRFIPGRHGYASRMQWNYSIRSLGKVAQGRGKKLEDVAADADSDEPVASKLALHDHEFPLRADYKVKISLPADFTDKEAERLSAFLKVLPLR